VMASRVASAPGVRSTERLIRVYVLGPSSQGKEADHVPERNVGSEVSRAGGDPAAISCVSPRNGGTSVGGPGGAHHRRLRSGCPKEGAGREPPSAPAGG